MRVSVPEIEEASSESSLVPSLDQKYEIVAGDVVDEARQWSTTVSPSLGVSSMGVWWMVG